MGVCSAATWAIPCFVMDSMGLCPVARCMPPFPVAASELPFGLSDDVPPCSLEDDRVVEISGEYAVVHTALRLVCLHLRRFLCDHSVLPLFEHNVGVRPC